MINLKTILIVDDDERNIFALSTVMKHKGFRVETALDGEECIKKLTSVHSIDLVLMDIMMPVMDGYESIRIIRSNPSTKHIPIIALTANAIDGDKEKCLSIGANDYLPKPIKIEELISKIEYFFK